MSRIRAIACVALAASFAAAQSQSQWNRCPLNGHWYTTIPHPGAYWCQLELTAASMGGHLVTVRSQAEQDWLVGLVPANVQFIAIGASDQAIEGIWTWANGEPFVHVPAVSGAWNPWAPGEPNNGPVVGQGLEHHAYMERALGWKWNDACGCSCSGGPPTDQRAAIVEVLSDDCDQNGVPDRVEIALNPALDLDSNGALDRCQPWYQDLDSDGYGSAVVVCSQVPTCGQGTSLVPGDCDDTHAQSYPGAPELCDGLDNDCDGAIDEGFISTYCTAGTSVHGCTALITGVGAPSTTASSGFDIIVSNVPGQRYGTIFYGFYPANVPWAPNSPSYRCVSFPIQRMGNLPTHGSTNQCNGDLTIDFNAWYAANPGALAAPFVSGQVFYAQGWYRDPAAPKQTNLSNGLRFTLCN